MIFMPPPLQDVDNEEAHTEEDRGIVDSAVENNASSDIVIIADEDNLRSPRQKPSTPKKVRAHRKRQSGESYIGRDGTVKQARVMKEHCNCKCRGTKCNLISYDERCNLFEEMWSVSWDSKRAIVKGLVDRVAKKRTFAEDSNRKWSYNYHLKTAAGERIRVCYVLFENTLAVGEWFIRSVLEKPLKNPNTKRPQKEPTAAVHYLVNTFFNNLPKMPSHYCRKSTDKTYIERRYQSLKELHTMYKQECEKEEQEIVCLTTFKKTFHMQNLKLHQPKKDKCDICVSYEVGHISKDDYDNHIDLKDRARLEKENDKLQAKEREDLTVLCMDLESVLLAPKIEASALYYKTKLIVHNFTIYNMISKDCKCYVWHEGEGGLTANEFASCVVDYITNTTTTAVVIIYSDGCVYQNKNTVLACAIRKVCKEKNITVIHKYLVKGHTQMEVDSCHSLIERALKKVLIYVPMDYINVFRNARVNPNPFNVQYVNHTFFKDFSNVGPFTSIRPGRGKGDPTVVDIRCLKYSPDGSVQYKLNFDSEWDEIPEHRVNNGDGIVRQLYKNRLKIPGSKFQHLQDLKEYILDDHHDFYDNLEHDTTKK